MSDLVIFGSLNYDVFNYVDRFPAPGETLQANDYVTGVGGKGCNQCAMAGIMIGDKHKVVMAGAVGDDVFGTTILESLKKCNVDTGNVHRRADVGTGVATITVDAHAENNIIIYAGANGSVQPKDAENSRDVIQNTKVLVCQNELPLETTKQALEMGKAAGVTTVFNPAPASSDISVEILKLADIVVPNETETAILLGETGANFETDEELEAAAKRLWKLCDGQSTIVMTAGSKGAIIVHKSGNLGSVKPPALDSPAVDTSGAGDCFLGAVTAHLATNDISEESIELATKYGCCAASFSVQKRGCQISYPTREQVLSKLDL
mmetsp:Transcript_5348/g.8268  ORF Transcript_5348/g.8268 Transcript_5348/m.8268 type:complete len:321 (+) Transcript_5348:171-1133(+)